MSPDAQELINDISETSDEEEQQKCSVARKHINDVSESSDEEETPEPNSSKGSVCEKSEEVTTKAEEKALGKQKSFNKKDFIKEKFLFDMPTDFYQFWEFCKRLNEKSPCTALKDAGLLLVGPYDVLANKFLGSEERSEESYLLHWRFFHDPPEFQTVIKGDDATGFHIGYFRDVPSKEPVFLAANSAVKGGEFSIMGENIFAAVR